jgi:hypothetical protein
MKNLAENVINISIFNTQNMGVGTILAERERERDEQTYIILYAHAHNIIKKSFLNTTPLHYYFFTPPLILPTCRNKFHKAGEKIPSPNLLRPSAELPWLSTKLSWPSAELSWPSAKLSWPSTELAWPSTELAWPSTELSWPSAELSWPPKNFRGRPQNKLLKQTFNNNNKIKMN